MAQGHARLYRQKVIIDRLATACQEWWKHFTDPATVLWAGIWALLIELGKRVGRVISNFFEHRRLLSARLIVGHVASGTYTYDFLSGVPRFYDEEGNEVPGYEARIICEKLGGRKKLRKMWSPYATCAVTVDGSYHILRRMLVPKRDKLHLLPSKLQNEDFEWIDVLQLCKDLYQNTLQFLGSTYAVLLSKFKNLPKTKG